jgi:hypothetical protein
LGIFGRYKKVEMAKNAAPGFIEEEVAQTLIPGNPAGLFPDRFARRRCDTTDNDVTYFPFSMAADNVYDLCSLHFNSLLLPG